MTPDVSIVVPVFNETGNVGPLAREIAAAFAGQAYEMIFQTTTCGFLSQMQTCPVENDMCGEFLPK